jgi:hypothetical protein
MAARADPFWNETWGASLPWRADLDGEEADAFVRHGLSLL